MLQGRSRSSDEVKFSEEVELSVVTKVNKSVTLPDASLRTLPPTINAIKRYERVVKRMANKVPFGIADWGSLSSSSIIVSNGE